MSSPEAPSLSVIMPIREEAEHLEAAVGAVLRQDYPGPFQVVLAVAPSSDTTHTIAEHLAALDARIQVVNNPTGTTPAGLNRAIEAATGEIVARVDAHAELSPGYLSRAVEVLARTGAANVGGVQRAVGTTPMQRAIAAAMSSRFGTGDARFHYGGEAGPIDTVYLGVFRAQVLRQLGGFDEALLRNQDYELNVRIRAAGEVVWFDPLLEVIYRPRSSLRGLASQYWQYGRWKRATLRKHPGSMRWRQGVPPVVLIANALGCLGAVFSVWTLALPSAYVIGVVGAGFLISPRHPAQALRLVAVLPTMHHAWAAGFLTGPPREV